MKSQRGEEEDEEKVEKDVIIVSSQESGRRNVDDPRVVFTFKNST